MENRENPLLGRKVFFLNPPLSIENYVIDSLKNEEYEVYKITDLTYAKPLLRHFENAICFIFIDDVLTIDGWFNFIKSFEKDESLKSIFLGVLTVKLKPKEQERFLLNLKLPGGFVMLDKKIEETKKQLEGILSINGAKGVRKCIRLDLKDRKDVNGYLTIGDQLFSFRLIDMSIMGFAAVLPLRLSKYIKKDTFIHNVSITMGRFSFVSAITVYAVKENNGKLLLIALFVDGTSRDIIKKIHNFVYNSLDNNMKDLIDNLPPDYTDYNSRLVEKAEEASENNDEVVELEEVDAASEEKTDEKESASEDKKTETE